MTNNNHIVIVVTSYKDKNLFDFVDKLNKNTYTTHSIEVFEQHPIDHSKEFSQITECSYDHKIWDDIAGMPVMKSEKVSSRLDNSTYICLMTPDSVVTPGWDLRLMELIGNREIVVSGNGKAIISHKDLFSLDVRYFPFNESVKNQIIDKNFIFAKTEAFKNIRMPDFLKYCGEDEYMTLAFMSNGYDIYSAPNDLYIDTNNRSIENTYHTFSSEHNYNIVVDIMHKLNLQDYKISASAVDEFLAFHKIDADAINRLPYQTNDVDYNPYNLKMHEVDARRFMAGTKAVY